jgi:hypothetical protein
LKYRPGRQDDQDRRFVRLLGRAQEVAGDPAHPPAKQPAGPAVNKAVARIAAASAAGAGTVHPPEARTCSGSTSAPVAMVAASSIATSSWGVPVRAASPLRATAPAVTYGRRAISQMTALRAITAASSQATGAAGPSRCSAATRISTLPTSASTP